MINTSNHELLLWILGGLLTVFFTICWYAFRKYQERLADAEKSIIILQSKIKQVAQGLWEEEKLKAIIEEAVETAILRIENKYLKEGRNIPWDTKQS